MVTPILITTAIAVACSTATSPSAGIVTFIAYLTQASVLKTFMITSVVLMGGLIYIVQKLGIKLNILKLFDKKEDVAIANKLVTQFAKRSQTIENIDKLKAACNKEIRRETEILITKAMEVFDDWFNKSVLKETRSEDMLRCQDCKITSFRSTLENIELALKKECWISFEKNGFLHAEGIHFEAYVKNLHATFRKTMRSIVIHFYIHPNEIDKYFAADPPNPYFEKMMDDIYDIFHDIITNVKEKEIILYKDIDNIETKYDKDMRALLTDVDISRLVDCIAPNSNKDCV